MSVDDGSSSDDDDDFNFESSHVGSKRYPVHDCCENEDAESLKVSRGDCRSLWARFQQDTPPPGGSTNDRTLMCLMFFFKFFSTEFSK
jgi:hypothetical protein